MPTVNLAGARWRKSSRSGGAGSNGACVEVALATASCRKSSHSGGGNNTSCVEVAFSGAAAAVRDSKNPGGPALVFPAGAWHDLITAARAGELAP
jgi:hypothetical protein